MRKLNKKKIRWILRAKNRGITKKQVASVYEISPRWVQHVWNEYRKHGRIIVKKPGRKKKPIPLDHIKLILREHPSNSCAVYM